MWTFHNPVAIQAGPGVLAQLPAYLGTRRAILITFPEADTLGLTRSLGSLLGERLKTVVTDIQPNPDVAWLGDLYARLWREHADAECIIALGGGSVIDTAKAMLTATPSRTFGELLAHLQHGTPLPADGHKQLIAIPTTAGTGSEVTPWATLWDQAAGRKYSLHCAWTWPQAALIDPQLMRSLPRGMTLASGLDALSHALESLWNRHRNPISSRFAVTAARQILGTLPALLAEPGNLVLRQRMAEAALFAGIAFSNTKTALAHSLSYDVTLQTGTIHGLACSFSLPRILALASGRNADLDRELCEIFATANVTEAATVLERFLADLGVSTDPMAYGIPPECWHDRLQQALSGPRGENFICQGNHLA